MSIHTIERLNAAPKMDARPRCAGCNARRRPYWVTIEYGSVARGTNTKLRWDGQYHGYGHFCTMRCALDFANRVAERMKR